MKTVFSGEFQTQFLYDAQALTKIEIKTRNPQWPKPSLGLTLQTQTHLRKEQGLIPLCFRTYVVITSM